MSAHRSLKPHAVVRSTSHPNRARASERKRLCREEPERAELAKATERDITIAQLRLEKAKEAQEIIRENIHKFYIW